MSTYEIAVRIQEFKGFGVARMYERFLDWWASLYVDLPPRHYL